jgi:TatA/E family protein of Tat protein translocase
MGNLGWPEIMIILVIALIIFGPRKLPELGKTLGQSLAQFRKASEDFKRQWEDEVEIEKRRLNAPPAEVEPSRATSGETLDSVKSEAEASPAEAAEPVAAETVAAEAAPTEESSTIAPADAEPVTVARSEPAVNQTKRDWM